jgi:GNAT superfamily N-acetyltransferase
MPRFDAEWLFEQNLTYLQAFGDRDDLPGLIRWRNADEPLLRDGNHAMVPPQGGLIPGLIDQHVDRARRDGAVPCIDIYGAADERDDLCRSWGLRQEPAEPLDLVAWKTTRTLRKATPASAKRPAPPAQRIPRREWVDAVVSLRSREGKPWLAAFAMRQALMENATFYGLRVGEPWVAIVARYDFGATTQFAGLYVDPAFRRTGFAPALVLEACATATSEDCFVLAHAGNSGLERLLRSFGLEPSARDVRRRYVLAG